MNSESILFPPPDPRVTELARRCLEDIDSLVGLWVECVRPVRASYADRVSEEEFRATAWEAFEFLLRTVARLPLSERIATVSERVGERRAREGVPLDSLLEAARLDFRVVWAALVEKADEKDKAELVTSAYHVWEAVEKHVTGIMTAYQRTILDMGAARRTSGACGSPGSWTARAAIRRWCGTRHSPSASRPTTGSCARWRRRSTGRACAGPPRRCAPRRLLSSCRRSPRIWCSPCSWAGAPRRTPCSRCSRRRRAGSLPPRRALPRCLVRWCSRRPRRACCRQRRGPPSA